MLTQQVLDWMHKLNAAQDDLWRVQAFIDHWMLMPAHWRVAWVMLSLVDADAEKQRLCALIADLVQKIEGEMGADYYRPVAVGEGGHLGQVDITDTSVIHSDHS